MFDLAIAALIGFLFGVLVGYLWRDRISRARRARYGPSKKGMGPCKKCGARSRWKMKDESLRSLHCRT